ncbi:hypothetical protein EZX49_11795 [Salmonella enterica subsp. enterica serovar Indiana]|nr:hypothetical protein [Salmonella enterica subsp. enterica serovar Stanley]EAB9238480.1 hypothetical protein [Salmonella enterica subsp. enterica serovar Indiana]EAM8557749.1 hypothetical protein [Salmonella enterica]EBG3213472.1 hypothetical protein [Salmonella enterica subsp. enterica serovar Newport]EBS4496497.1 hypothetical protein [Salmonella enterica subsp. enterica serovar Agona]EBU8601773.1 hypothetical protein [Salmonella enterica subsp. enterica serovar Chester]EBV2761988.1 hypoth
MFRRQSVDKYTYRTVPNLLFTYSRGSVTVEYALIFPVLVLIALILLDFTALYANESRLARASSSLASVFRERTLLYEENEYITNTQVDDLLGVANSLLAQSQLSGRVNINVQAVYFDTSSTEVNKVINDEETISITKLSAINPLPCTPAHNIESETLTALSAWTSDVGGTLRWLPVYQITLCVKGDESFFMKALSHIGVVLPDIVSSNAVVPR